MGMTVSAWAVRHPGCARARACIPSQRTIMDRTDRADRELGRWAWHRYKLLSRPWARAQRRCRRYACGRRLQRVVAITVVGSNGPAIPLGQHGMVPEDTPRDFRARAERRCRRCARGRRLQPVVPIAVVGSNAPAIPLGQHGMVPEDTPRGFRYAVTKVLSPSA